MCSRRTPYLPAASEASQGMSTARPGRLYPRLKYCTARSCFCAAAREENVPRFFRFPVFTSFLREYKRYSPDCNLRIMHKKDARIPSLGWCKKKTLTRPSLKSLSS